MTAGLARLASRYSAEQLAWITALSSRALLGWFVSYPPIALAATLGQGALARDDRELFEPSGLMLLDLVRRGAEAFPAAARTSLLLMVVALLIHTLPTAFVFSAFAGEPSGSRAALRRALVQLPRFWILGLSELAATALLVVFASLTWGLMAPSEAQARTWAAMALVAVTLGLVAAIAIVCDLARTDSIRSDSAFGETLRFAARAALQRPHELCGSYVLASGTGALAVALAARGVGALAVHREGAWRVALVFTLHLAALGALGTIQALWVRKLRRYATPPSPRA